MKESCFDWRKTLQRIPIFLLLLAATAARAEEQIVRLVQERGHTLVIDVGARTVTDRNGKFPANIMENAIEWVTPGKPKSVERLIDGSTMTSGRSETFNSLDRTSLVHSWSYTSFCQATNDVVFTHCGARDGKIISGRDQYQIAKKVF